MTAWHRALAVLLRASAGGRNWKWRRTLSACLPRAFKDRVNRLRAALVRRVAGGALPAVAAGRGTLPARRVDPVHAGDGVDCVGYARAEMGLGETVRAWARAFAGAGYPFTLVDVGAGVPGRQDDHALDAWIEPAPRHAARLCCVNPDLITHALHGMPRAGSRMIGYWLWELETFPPAWRAACAQVDEIWAPTTFVQRAIAAATGKPVVLMPLPVEFEVPPPLPRAALGLAPDAFVFAFSFDFHSYPERKNPWAVIAAFRAAFPRARRDVQLLLKTSNGERLGDQFTRLMQAAAGDPRIVVRDGHLDRAGMYALLATVDAYVSLHRAEGIGLGLAEAMYLGKPVIATAWSGNLDFMSEREAKLVDCRLVPVAAGAYPNAEGQHWAEADVQQAARYMRELADDRAAATALGAAGRARIRRQYAPATCAAAAIARLQAIAMTPGKPLA